MKITFGLGEALLRTAEPGDLPMVMSDWLHSFRSAGGARRVPSEVYFQEQRSLIERLLVRSAILCATNPEQADQVFGWMCFEPRESDMVGHYLYVKSVYRRQGLARAMLATLTGLSQYTHRTQWTKIVAPLGAAVFFNPYLLWSANVSTPAA